MRVKYCLALLPLFLAACGGGNDGTSDSSANSNSSSVSPLFSPIQPKLVVMPPSSGEISVATYGAKGDGTTLDTEAIQKALDEASKLGNRTVIFPVGTYLTGALFVKSNSQVRIDENVTLLGVQDNAKYPKILTRTQGYDMEWPAALINLYQAENVKVYGKGVIDGQGEMWWDKFNLDRKTQKKDDLAFNYDQERPRLFEAYKAKNIQIQGVTLKRSPFWTLHLVYSDQIHVDGIFIRNVVKGRLADAPSTDGVDIDSSTNVLVENADIEASDDALVLKSGRDADGLRVNRPTENILIRNSIVRTGSAALSIGSETSGSVRNIEAYGVKVIANKGEFKCNIGYDVGTPTVVNGLIFKSANTRGGIMENIHIHDFDIDSLSTSGIEVALSWGNTKPLTDAPAWVPRPLSTAWQRILEEIPAGKGTPYFRNIKIANFKVANAAGSTKMKAFKVSGVTDSLLEGFILDNVQINAGTPGSVSFTKDWQILNSNVTSLDAKPVTFQNTSGLIYKGSTGFTLPAIP